MAFKDGSKQRGGKAYRQHTSLKDAVRKRDNYTCQICGEYGNQVDHIIPYAISHDSSIKNLRTLCRNCNLSLRRPQYNTRLPLDKWFAKLEAELKESQKVKEA